MKPNLQKSGILQVGTISWGYHLGLFYKSKKDLYETIFPYIQAGLRQKEFCIWVTGGGLSREEVVEIIKKDFPVLKDSLSKGSLELYDYSDWFFGK